ncbi:MAG TPA: crosslink repair DNA glycosylase YcaQ family protein [Ktedonobacterales bacterium]
MSEEVLSLEEARGVMLAAQGLLDPPPANPGIDDVHALIERLGVLQIDTINVVRRTQYLVLWSRLGAYDDALLDELLYPRRLTFEYWSHAASIVPVSDYPHYRTVMLRAASGELWDDYLRWREEHPDVIQKTLEAIRERGPLGSADFERPANAKKTKPWDWYGPKESRVALDALWMTGELMVHSRRSGQKVYDLRERVLAATYGEGGPSDDGLPTPEESLRHFVSRTVSALGIVTPSWLWDYFRLRSYKLIPSNNGDGRAPATRAAAKQALEALAHAGAVIPATVDGLPERAYLGVERLDDLERIRSGAARERTTLLSPFDNLIWDRLRARQLFGHEVVFEAYVVPEKRRYGYYSLAILHRGQIVGRLDPKMDRATQQLLIRGVYLELGATVDAVLLDGLAETLRDLARFLGATSITVERSEPSSLATKLRPLLKSPSAKAPRKRARMSATMTSGA